MLPPIQSFILRILQAEDKVHFSSTSAALRGFQPHYPPIHPFLQHSFVHVFVRQQCSYEAQHKSHVFTLSNAGHIATRSKPKFRFQESFLGSSLYQRRPKLCLRNAFMPHDQSLITPPPPLGGIFFLTVTLALLQWLQILEQNSRLELLCHWRHSLRFCCCGLIFVSH